MTLSGATTQSQSGPGSDGNKGVHRNPQSSIITGISPSDHLVLYPSAEMQAVYFAAPADDSFEAEWPSTLAWPP